jgi:hypothetical protein
MTTFVDAFVTGSTGLLGNNLVRTKEFIKK